MYKIDIKPFSNNDCKRPAKKVKMVSTQEYKDWEMILRFKLNALELPMVDKGEKLYLIMETTFLTQGSDWDNPIKPFQDVLAKVLDFNDNKIQMGFSRKRVIDKNKDEEPSIRFMIFREGEKDKFFKVIQELSEDLK